MIQSAQPTHGKPLIAIGLKLRLAREANHWTLHELSARTRIPVRHLDTIESGRSQELPGGFIGKSFVRQYAEAVGLDGDQTLQEFIAQTGINLEVPFQERKISPYTPEALRRFQSQMWRNVGMGVLGLLLLVAFGIYAFRKTMRGNESLGKSQAPTNEAISTGNSPGETPPLTSPVKAPPQGASAVQLAADAGQSLSTSRPPATPARNTSMQEGEAHAAPGLPAVQPSTNLSSEDSTVSNNDSVVRPPGTTGTPATQNQ